MHYFIGLVIISVCVKCFNIDVCIYGTLLLLPSPPPFFSFFFLLLILAFCCCHFDIDVCIYNTCTFVVVVVDCQADFDFDNVQRRELVNIYEV